MKKYITILVSSLIIISGGCNNAEKEANKRLEQARINLENNDFFAARNEIDSIRKFYPKEYKILKVALTVMRQIDIKEAKRNIAYCDSLLPIRQQELENMKKDFKFEKDSLYETIGNYIWKYQTIERNVERCYIRSGVNEHGEMYLASVYYGAKPIEHTGIKLSTPDGTFVETPEIAYDGGNNYRFSNLGNTTEVVTYKAEKGENAIKFIYDNANNRIKVEYLGGKPYIIYIADADKKALVATYNLAVVLNDIYKMTTARENALKRIEYLNNKLNS